MKLCDDDSKGCKSLVNQEGIILLGFAACFQISLVL